MTDHLLTIRGLNVTYPSRRGVVTAIEDVDLDVSAGEIVGLVGESGAGKSTIGSALLGLIDPPGVVRAKDCRFEGERHDIANPASVAAVRGKRIGIIFQDPLTSLDPLFTVGDQLVETMCFHLPIDRAEARRRAVELLRSVGINDAETRIGNYPHQFSGGMRQRVVIALAICCDPRLIIADEPTTALDVSVQAQVLALIRKLAKERNVGVVFVTHDMGVIAEVTDRVAVMYRGRVVETGPTRQILTSPQHRYSRSLIAAVPRGDVKLPRFPRVAYRPDGDDDAGRLVTEAEAPRAEPGDEAARGGIAVSVKGLRKSFITRPGILGFGARHFLAVDDVSFDIEPGEILGLVGESGSGKSTIAHMIAGLLPVSGGSIAIRDTGGTENVQPQMIFQDPYSSLNPRITVGDIIAEPIRFHRLESNEADTQRRVVELLEQVGLGKQHVRRFPHQFSGGERQRISIARALALRPRFLICDEPTSALDVSIQAQVLNLLKDLQERYALTMLFISHDLPVVRQMCDRIAVLRNGKLQELAPTEQLFDAPGDPYTRELLRLVPSLGPDIYSFDAT